MKRQQPGPYNPPERRVAESDAVNGLAVGSQGVAVSIDWRGVRCEDPVDQAVYAVGFFGCRALVARVCYGQLNRAHQMGSSKQGCKPRKRRSPRGLRHSLLEQETMRIKVTRTITASSARPLAAGRARDASLRASSEAFQPVRIVD
jgi:hypothetical protein